MATNQQLWNIALNLQSIQEVFYQFLSIICFAPIDQLSIQYTGCWLITLVFTSKGVVNWTNMVFLGCLSERIFHEVRRVFKFCHKIHHFKLFFALKLYF